jgi:hypothetical protein
MLKEMFRNRDTLRDSTTDPTVDPGMSTLCLE